MTQTSSARRKPRLPRALFIVLGVVVLAIVGVVACQMRPKPDKDPYRFGAVERGAITRSVSASGTLQALITVDVGSQISGQIREILVDFNDHVSRGQTMAILDPQTYQTRVAQGQADVAAGVATLRQAEAAEANAKADYERKKTLVAQGIYSASVLDQAQAAYRTASAAVTAAKARILQSRAALKSQQVDLGRTTIVAPIDGIVVDRKVEPGNSLPCGLSASAITV
jgi:HlyD family secretion protein